MAKTIIGKRGLYGKELVLDLEECEPSAIRSRGKIAAYARKLCRVIAMKPYGKPFVERFGLGKDFTSGYSLVQLIETSSITGHFSELWNTAHINIFSCRDFDPKAAAAFTKRYFGAKRMAHKVLIRRGAGTNARSRNLRYGVECKGRWVFERQVPHDETSQRFGFRVRKKMYAEQSRYQTIEAFDLAHYGRTLFLDGILQVTERDEFIYHEMLVHPALFLHQKPQRVLIVGGGDGGALEEALKHPIREAWMAEIDERVIEVSQKYLSAIAKGAFYDKRAHVIVGDGKDFVGNYRGFFDAIILDLSDPHGPARRLIEAPFYRNVRKALKEGGIVSVQSGSFGAQPRLVKTIQRNLGKVFRFTQVRRATIQTYPVGEYAFTLAADWDFRRVAHRRLERRFRKPAFRNLRYWSPEMHEASAVLPKYLP